MSRSQLLYLYDIAEAAESIRAYIGPMSYEEFSKDKMRIDAVVRNFEIIGEAAKNINKGKKTVPRHRLEGGSRSVIP